MKSLAKSFLTVLCTTSILSANSIHIQKGWTLQGTGEDINISNIQNNCIEYIWKYNTSNPDNPIWELKTFNGISHEFNILESIKKDEGFWVKTNEDCINNMSEIVDVFSTSRAFTALKSDGTVVTWGRLDTGGDSSGVKNQLNNIKEIFSTVNSFAALKNDGTVVTWGNDELGGDSSKIKDHLTNVKTIFSNNSTFVALKEDGTAISWGSPYSGGNNSIFKSTVYTKTQTDISKELVNIKTIFSNDVSFIGIRNDGSIITWGSYYNGGDSSSVKDQLNNSN